MSDSHLITVACRDGRHHVCRGRAINPVAKDPRERWVACGCTCGIHGTWEWQQRHGIMRPGSKRKKSPARSDGQEA